MQSRVTLIALYRILLQRRSEKHSVELEVFLRTDWTQDMDCWIIYFKKVSYLRHTMKTFVRCVRYDKSQCCVQIITNGVLQIVEKLQFLKHFHCRIMQEKSVTKVFESSCDFLMAVATVC